MRTDRYAFFAPPGEPAARPARIVMLYLYDGVDEFDLGVAQAALQVAERAQPAQDEPPLRVVTVSASGGLVRTRGRHLVMPSHTWFSAPVPHLLVVLGGCVDAQIADPGVLSWLAEMHGKTQLTAAMTEGVRLLEAAGVLEGEDSPRRAKGLRALSWSVPSIRTTMQKDVVELGRVLTTSSRHATIDLCIKLVQRLSGEASSAIVAHNLMATPPRTKARA